MSNLTVKEIAENIFFFTPEYADKLAREATHLEDFAARSIWMVPELVFKARAARLLAEVVEKGIAERR